MKKILLVAAVLLMVTVSLFAQAKKVYLHPGDTVIVGNTNNGSIAGGISTATPVRQHKPIKNRYRIRYIRYPQPQISYPTVNQLPRIDSSKLVAEYYQKQMADHEKWMYILLSWALFGIIIVIVLVGLYAYHIRNHSYSCIAKDSLFPASHQTFNLHGGAASSESHGGAGGDSRNTIYSDSEKCGNYADVRETVFITDPAKKSDPSVSEEKK